MKASYNAITSKHLYIQEYETSIDTLVEEKKIIFLFIKSPNGGKEREREGERGREREREGERRREREREEREKVMEKEWTERER